MSTEDKMKNNADLAKGKIKEGIGRATNDKGLEGEASSIRAAPPPRTRSRTPRTPPRAASPADRPD